MIEGIQLGRIASHKLPQPYDIEPLVPDQDNKTSSCHSEFKLCIDLKHLQLPVKNAPVNEPVQMIDTTETEIDVQLDENFCGKTHQQCGHRCKGYKDEKTCTPCLKKECASKQNLLTDENELCSICFTSELREEPVTALKCGHAFHVNCIVELLKAGSSGARLAFGFLECPVCRSAPISGDCEPISSLLQPLLILKSNVEKMAMDQAKNQGLFEQAGIDNPKHAYYSDRLAYALKRTTFYQCYDCKEPYFGGLIDCVQAANDNQAETKKEDMKCQKCLIKELGVGQTTCSKHGTAQIDWKCMYCCSVATFHCFGTHYFCTPCHNMWGRDIPLKDCHGVNCPLGVAHPPPNSNPRLGGVFPLGCGICRSEKLEVMKKYQMQMVANGQMDQSELFKRWYKCDINRPLFEVDFSGFFQQLEEQEQRDYVVWQYQEQLRIVNLPPVKFISLKEAAKRKRKAERKAAAAAAAEEALIPAFILDPNGEEVQKVHAAEVPKKAAVKNAKSKVVRRRGKR